jgi:hypothetical protein
MPVSGAGIQKNKTKTPQERAEEILETEEMETLLEKIGDPAVQRGQSQTIIINIKDESITSTILPTPLGDAVYGQKDDVSEADFAFGSSVLNDAPAQLSPGFAEKLPEPFDKLPLESPGVHIVSSQGSPVQGRTGTSEENEAVAETLNISSDEADMLAVSDVDDLILYDNSKEENKIYAAPSPSSEIPYREMTSEEMSDLSISSEGVGTLVADCYTYRKDCASYVGASCIGACTIAGVATFGAAFALCGICAGSSAFVAGTACGKYYEECL